MWKTIQIPVGLLLLFMIGCAAYKPPPDKPARKVIAQDTVWQGQLEIADDLVVLAGVTLKVKPGTVIRFKKSTTTRIDPRFLFTTTELVIRGSLLAEGTPEEPILFTSAEKQPQIEDWAGIILDGADSAVIKHAQIEFAQTAIYCINASPKIEQNELLNNKYGIICQLGSFPYIQQNEISAGEVGIACWDGSAPKIMDNHIFDNRRAGILWGSGATPWFEKNIIEGNRYGIFGGEEYIWTTNKIQHNEDDFYLSPQNIKTNTP